MLSSKSDWITILKAAILKNKSSKFLKVLGSILSLNFAPNWNPRMAATDPKAQNTNMLGWKTPVAIYPIDTGMQPIIIKKPLTSTNCLGFTFFINKYIVTGTAQIEATPPIKPPKVPRPLCQNLSCFEFIFKLNPKKLIITNMITANEKINLTILSPITLAKKDVINIKNTKKKAKYL